MLNMFSVLMDSNRYTITAQTKGNYNLFYSLSPDGFTSDAFLCGFADAATVENPTGVERCYFHILDENANHWVAAVRVLPFSKVENFRELGGYPAKENRFVKWGRFYRSARLTHLDEEETLRFMALGMKSVLDLRSTGEIAAYPDPIFERVEQKAISAIIEMDGNEKNFDPAQLLVQTEEEMRKDEADFMNIYRNMPFHNAAYQWMFDRLLEEKTPILFHCTAGKDRTGIAAALILMALGTPRSVIEEDYMLTNLCCQKNIEKMIEKYYKPGQPVFVKEYLSCIGGVGLHNLAAALDAVEEKYPTPEAFFEAEYGLTAQKLSLLQSIYTEPVHT